MDGDEIRLLEIRTAREFGDRITEIQSMIIKDFQKDGHVSDYTKKYVNLCNESLFANFKFIRNKLKDDYSEKIMKELLKISVELYFESNELHGHYALDEARGPMLITQRVKSWVSSSCQDVSFALLYAAEAVDACGTQSVGQFHRVEPPCLVDAVDAGLPLDAVQAAETAFELDGGEFRDRGESGQRRLQADMDVVLA